MKRWRIGSDVSQINEVALHRTRLALGWVTVSGLTSGAWNLSRSNERLRSTQPGHPSMGRRSEYRPRAVMLCDWA